jgi:hypothetical protein
MSFLAHMMRRWLRTSIGAGVLVWPLFLPGPSFALHRQTPFIEPIPFPAINGSRASGPSARARPRAGSPSTPSDLLGNGSGGSEIFLWDNDPADRGTWSRSPTVLPATANPADDANGNTVVFEVHEHPRRPALHPLHADAPDPAHLRAQQIQGSSRTTS